MEKQFCVTALGELLIDFTDSGLSGQGNSLFEANPGGAPCNVLAMLNQLGHKTAFIGKVGDDIFGHRLKKVLEEVGIDTRNLLMDKEVRTTLAFVANDESGERDFSFYRNPGADMMLCEEELDEELIKTSHIFHFGTLSMTHENVRNATKKALAIAKEHDVLISFDPNLREPLWKNLDEAKEQVAFGLSYCDVLKISDNEIVWFTGESDYTKAVEIIRQKYDIPLILVSMGKEGSRAYYKDFYVEVPAFVREDTIDTTGAGDTFGGCCLHFILKLGIKSLLSGEWTKEQLEEMLTFANKAASIVTARKGALRVMPCEDEIYGTFE